jgi:hypothetical protein
MRRAVFVAVGALICLLAAGQRPAKADSITVLNPSFEMPALAGAGTFQQNSFTGWTVDTGAGGFGGVFWPTTAEVSPVPNGNQVGVAGSASGTAGTLSQNITTIDGVTPTPGTTYTLTVDVGRQANLYSAWSIELQAGTASQSATGLIFASSSSSFAFETVSVTDVGTGPLIITLGDLGQGNFGNPVGVEDTQSLFDEVTLTSNTPAAPEPGTLTLAALGIAGLLGYAWRRRKLAVA